MMKLIIGFVMVAAGLVLGAYVGIWLCLVGGIIDIINQIKAPDLSASVVAWGIAKVLLCGIAGWLSAAVLMIPGIAIAKGS